MNFFYSKILVMYANETWICNTGLNKDGTTRKGSERYIFIGKGKDQLGMVIEKYTVGLVCLKMLTYSASKW